MKIKISYGAGFEIVEVPDKNLAGIIGSAKKCELKCESLGDAIKNPIDSPSIEEFLAGDSSLLVIVNDTERPTPTARILDIVEPYMSRKNPNFIVATGTHKPADETALREIFGKYYEKYCDRIRSHVCTDESKIVYIGTTSRGTEVSINKIALEHDRIIVIGSVEPHYFAGFTGGRKGFLPGISSEKTIEQNHALSLEPNARPLSLKGNPVHEDMLEAIGFINKPIFSIQVVVDSDKSIVSATAGEINKSFYKAVEYAMEIQTARIQNKADIVLVEVRKPMDISLYQSHKAIENCKGALEDGGVLILVSACREGIGPDNFYKILTQANSREEIKSIVGHSYKVGYHKALRIVELAERADIFAVTDIPDEIIEPARMTPFHSVQSALMKAIEKCGEDARILVVLDGTGIVVFEDGEIFQ